MATPTFESFSNNIITYRSDNTETNEGFLISITPEKNYIISTINENGINSEIEIPKELISGLARFFSGECFRSYELNNK